MTSKLKSKIYKTFLLQLLATVFISSEIYPQQRVDEEMPKIVGSIKSIINLKGWARDDIGKWYEFNTAFNSVETRDQVLKISLAKINYENRDYICIAAFNKSFYIRANIKHIEYSAFFWLLDTTKFQKLSVTDSSIHTMIYQNFIVSSVLGGYYKPITWNDILIQMKKCFIGTVPNDIDSSQAKTRRTANRLYNVIYPPDIDSSYDPYENFFIKYRFDYKHDKAQFFIGTLRDDPFAEVWLDNGKHYSKFDFTNGFLFIDCYDKERNRNLQCRYFETEKILLIIASDVS